MTQIKCHKMQSHCLQYAYQPAILDTRTISKISVFKFKTSTIKVFVLVEILWPSQLSGVMSSVAVYLYNHTISGQT